jgi:threonylcarbamoyladenosine tRNA methylthiotransferase MtaB
MRVHLQALGCRLNEAELAAWSREFRARGHQLTPEPETADLLVVNTCAVTEEAVRKSRKLLRRAQRENPRARLVVSGCYASLEAAAVADWPGVDLLVDNRDKDRLVEIATRELDLPAMPLLATEPGEQVLLPRGRQRAFVKVQDGCRYQCSFCIVTRARGEERSRPAAELVSEINDLQRTGVQEVVLAGVHLGGYGSDLDSSLTRLVETLLRDTAIPRLRLGSLEPWDIPEDFWDLFADPRLQPHLHLPLQSGADPVLRRMARRCRRQQFLDLAARARDRVPDLNLTTDIIVGFPGERDADWQDTLSAVSRAGFGHLHIFPFSPRAGTRAASLPDRVPAALLRARCAELQALGAQLKRATLAGYAGRRLPVLVEGPARGGAPPGHWFGYTPNYLQVFIPDLSPDLTPDRPGTDPGNRILEVDLLALADSGEALLGRPAQR